MAFIRSLFSRRAPEPSYPVLPAVTDSGESTVPGLYLAGEIAGTPLIKLGLNAGVQLIDRLGPELTSRTDALPPHADEGSELLDVLVVGAGSAGLGATSAAHARGLKYVTIEADRVAETVRNMMLGKHLLAEPLDVANQSTMWFEECSREKLLETWDRQIKERGYRIRTAEKVLDIDRVSGVFRVTTDGGPVSPASTFWTRRVILAVGKAGNPRKLGVAGEKAHHEKVGHRLIDPRDHADQDITVVGAGDVAAEAALALCETNRVTLVAIDRELTYPKKRNVDALREQEAAGRLTIKLATTVVDFTAGDVQLRQLDTGKTETIPNDFVFEMIGAELPTRFLQKVGIRLDNSWQVSKWIWLAVTFLFVYSIYSLKKVDGDVAGNWAGFPFNLIWSQQDGSYQSFASGCRSIFEVGFAPFAWMFSEAQYNNLLATTWFQQMYLYSLLYTIVMIGFGWEAMIRWKSRHQTARYLSLLTFQTVFFLGATTIGVVAVGVDHSWRLFGLYQPWPLYFHTFFGFNQMDGLFWFFAIAGILGVLLFIPLMARWHGKRFCTWICGCGGLAETLGDRWRHLAAKGRRSRLWEFQNWVILAAAFMVVWIVLSAGLTNARAHNASTVKKVYSYITDFWLMSVIPITLYPFFGGKVWCRYWCPLAKYNQILSRWFGKLKIASNDKCISCTECSKYCQVGVDVMNFAKNQQAFDNTNSACIHCGICIEVCPMNVLRFTTGDPKNGESEPAARTSDGAQK